MARRASGNSASRCNIIVSVEDEARDRLNEVAAALRSQGMKVIDVMPLGGVIAGEAQETDLAKLRKTAGVAALEIDSMFTAEPFS